MTHLSLTVILIVVLCLGQVACSTASVLTDIQITLNAIADLQGALPLAGISPALAAEIGAYARAAAAGVGQCAAALAMGGDTVTLIAQCGQDLTTVLKPTLPPGTPQRVVGLVEWVYSELKAVYAAIEAGQTGGTTTLAGPVAVEHGASVSATAPAYWQPGRRDANKLRALALRADKLAKQ